MTENVRNSFQIATVLFSKIFSGSLKSKSDQVIISIAKNNNKNERRVLFLEKFKNYLTVLKNSNRSAVLC